eukprot:gene39219-56900_t
MASNSTFRDAVAIIGAHYSDDAPSECRALNKPMITSEGWQLGWKNDWRGTTSLLRTLNSNWIRGRQQATIVWTLIYAWYSILPYAYPQPGASVVAYNCGSDVSIVIETTGNQWDSKLSPRRLAPAAISRRRRRAELAPAAPVTGSRRPRREGLAPARAGSRLQQQ